MGSGFSRRASGHSRFCLVKADFALGQPHAVPTASPQLRILSSPSNNHIQHDQDFVFHLAPMVVRPGHQGIGTGIAVRPCTVVKRVPKSMDSFSWVKTVSIAPLSTTAPRSSNTARSQHAAAKAKSCVATRIATPSAAHVGNNADMATDHTGSSDAVGSSMVTMCNSGLR